ncbi:family 78 glycoside hydrolase catalytic domain [uncultured Bacteroides sp.]|uniref:alpha-L-rhamnosidase n=1 Tax=uncultured Bacteroides sp. TaxID=162156 RepID=UPI002AA76313|nr:family 78 glycoside hydrolase catalytic domain [uncultured Bacteroides sp.]
MRNIKNLFILSFIIISTLPCFAVDKIQVNNIRVELKTNPVGLDVLKPRFSWKITSKMPNTNQLAYRIMVAESQKDILSEKNLIWDTQIIKDSSSLFVQYNGTKLLSRKTYFWKIKVYTNQGESNWNYGHWSMAFLNSSDWKASWIGSDKISSQDTLIGNTRLSARYLRKEFHSPKGIKSARLYISGLGLYECFINGKKVGNGIFTPAQTEFAKRVYYNVYDVKKLLDEKVNTIGVILGNGRYFPMRTDSAIKTQFPRLLLQLEIIGMDGKTTTVISDESWKITTNGPIRANNEYDGEKYNANLEMKGWDCNRFNDSSWEKAQLVSSPSEKITCQNTPSIRTMERITPISIKELKSGCYIVDMGQNMVGWANVTLYGKKDIPVTMRFSETLNSDGSPYIKNLRTAKATDIYIPSKDGTFQWEPKFTYHGFRFIEITGAEQAPLINDIVGCVNYDEMATLSTFECSDSLLNQLFHNAQWGIKGNYRSFPTDCPQRDERQGWLGDRATGCFGEAYMFDQTLLYEKWLDDMQDSQSTTGAISDVIPTYWEVFSDNITWSSAYMMSAYMLYELRGDRQGIIKHYVSMKKWLYYMKDKYLQDYILTKDTYGDWCMPPENLSIIHSKDPARITDGKVMSTTFFYHILNMMQEFAVIASHPEDVAAYKDLAAKIKDAYNTKYFQSDKGIYDNNTVTANLISLAQGLVPKGYEQKVFDNIVTRIEKDFDSHVSVGVVGIQFLMRTLTDYGRPDLAYTIATQKTFPSWGYMIANGASTIWELWNGNTADPSMNSGNHVMLLGDLMIWYHENLIGIKSCGEGDPFKHFTINPYFAPQLTYLNGSYESPYGKIVSNWEKTGSVLNWRVSVPANTSALIYMPTSSTQHISMNGKPISKYSEIKVVKNGNNKVVLNLPSGNYKFTIN